MFEQLVENSDSLEAMLQEFASHKSWDFGAIIGYDVTNDVGIVESDDGETLPFAKSQVAKFVYNGGRTAVLRTDWWWRWEDTPIPCIFKRSSVSLDRVVPWSNTKLKYTYDIIQKYKHTRVLIHGEEVWTGFGYWQIDQKWPKEECPLSDTFTIQTWSNGQWVPVAHDPRGKTY